jgi:hypothetical protein
MLTNQLRTAAGTQNMAEDHTILSCGGLRIRFSGTAGALALELSNLQDEGHRENGVQSVPATLPVLSTYANQLSRVGK